MTRYFLNYLLLLLSFVILIQITSCSSSKKIKYLQDIPDSGRLKTIPTAEYVAPKIQVDDILTVYVQIVDPQATAIINSGNIGGSTSSLGGGTSQMASAPPVSVPTPVLSTPIGYLVDGDGNITIPTIGKVKVAGLSTKEAAKVVFNAADQFYKNASVTVRFANFKVNIAGEVLKPGTYIMQNEKVTIFDALTMAGDLTIFGKRDNVLLIRENADGTTTPYRINLKNSNFMNSPYYYLRQNDYIYVEPDKGKAAATDAAQARTYTIIGSILTVLIVFLTRQK